ncbi:hypothetical protein TGAM01_v207675 [Trichoderma gamsii]|uniref:Short chain oxidoreductase/dehydrogenase n=1 Tax=Trichoderma gamsii TaxID=398673 RepID=A0A2P4ZGN5_9HYPO|nr:hypothetical protein TGAM01_v207675 [Trichoderma gamsii]PON23441.1 hypothetical protein TGAM01_v207675 [Trichoderma gamsii]
MVAHTFLITGASSGIGVQIVYAALAAGHKVLAATRNPQTAAAKYPTVQQQGGQWVEIDVDKRETEATVEKLVKENSVDILVCNAGYAMLGPLEEMSIDEFEAQLQTNTIGAVRCIKGALPHFRKNGAGTIVNVSSLAGFYGAPATTAYTASKFALSGFSEALATEVGIFGIRVILVEPGSFRTNLVTNLVVPARKINEYDGTPARGLVEYQHASDGQQPGDPIKGGKKIVDVATDVAGEELANKGKGEVLRVLLGSDCFGVAKQKLKKVEEQLDITEEIAKSTDFV